MTMSISAKDIAKLEQATNEKGHAHYRGRYVPGTEHVGIYRILIIWPDKLKEVEVVDGEWREAAVTFLEVNPRYFRSGYDKAQLLRCLKRAHLSPGHKRRLQAVLLDVVGRPSGVELRQYCQLAARLASKELASVPFEAREF